MPKKNKGPDLDMYLEGKRDRYVSYYDGAKRFVRFLKAGSAINSLGIR